MSQLPELLPCPFCGYKASMTNVESAASGRYMWIVGCDSEDCDVSFHGHARQIDAAANEVVKELMARGVEIQYVHNGKPLPDGVFGLDFEIRMHLPMEPIQL